MPGPITGVPLLVTTSTLSPVQ